MKPLANLLTGLSLVGGFVSILFSLERHFTLACWAILLSVVFDGLDGQIARLNSVSSEYGKQLDSLVDVIAFGIAPAVLGYIFIYQQFYLWATPALFAYLACSVVRLAKYNLIPKEKLSHFFCGLPTTAAGGVLASFILVYRKYVQLPTPGVFLLLVLLLAVLMVSHIKYINLDGLKSVALSVKIAFFILAGIGVIFRPEITLFSSFVIYLIFSPFMVKSIASSSSAGIAGREPAYGTGREEGRIDI
jgi:CDP-diacylglycerol--serine O-phosphatidyltransferase